MKCCLIIPPSIFLLDERVFPSLGILRVAAALEADGQPVDVLDLSGITNFEEAAHDYAVANKGKVFYGVTATTPQMPAATKVRVAIERAEPGAHIILGGPHPTLVAAAARRGSERGKRALAALNWSQIVAGDGERAILQIARGDRTWHIDADDPKKPLFIGRKEMDELPEPARHLIALDSYHYEIDGAPATSLIAQLGCPFACSFCGGRYSPMLRLTRTRSIQSVLDEVKRLHKNYGFRGFMCYDDKTEILTRDRGFVLFSDLKETDAVAVLDPSTEEMFFEVPERIIKRPHQGRMIDVSSRFVDLSVTPEHMMWASEDGSSYRRMPAESLERKDTKYLQRAKWTGTEFKTFSIPAYEQKFLGRNKGSPKVLSGTRTFPARPWIQFMAWYLSEGSCYRSKLANGGRGYRICIKQDLNANPDKVKEISSVLDALGYRNSYSSNQFHIDSKELYEYLKPFGKSGEKFVPDEIKQSSSSLIELFLETYIKGDGHVSPTGQKNIVSYSRRMIGDLQEMAIKAGWWGAEDLKRKRLLLGKSREPLISEKYYSSREYDGTVYCVTVSTGVILVRRNGRATWCGNCYDDELNVNKDMIPLMNGLSDLQDKLGVAFKLRGFVKSELFNKEQGEAMYRAGFRWILTGFESGSPRILENINKRATRDDNTRCVETARATGLKVKALMSIGHAGESEESCRDTQDWLLEAQPDDFDCTIITTYPGSPYYDDAIETKPGIFTFTSPRTGDKLHAVEVDYSKVADYYKGDPDGGYKAYVFTDYISSEELVSVRDDIERNVREKLHIPFNPSKPAQAYEHSMGQLPPFILRSTEPSRIPGPTKKKTVRLTQVP